METPELLTISGLKRSAGEGRVVARIFAQVEATLRKETREGKPYWELAVVDAEAKMTLRAWSDTPAFLLCENLKSGDFMEFSGEFAQNGAFGIDSKRWSCRPLTSEEKQHLLGGGEELRKKQAADYSFIVETVANMGDPRLRTLCELYLQEWGERLRRTAAARNYHHARRGGLVEHTSQMLRLAACVADVYPLLHRDLLLAGVLFHDCGKLWENVLPENGFSMAYHERGELLGHICIGIELINTLWRKLDLQQWVTLEPQSEDVRLHLLHLVAAHHGELEFGSPVHPKTPEAFALHHIDNLDAKLEMVASAYTSATPVAARIYDRVRPLPGNLVAPLSSFEG